MTSRGRRLAVAATIGLLAACSDGREEATPGTVESAAPAIEQATVAAAEIPRGPLAPRDDCAGDPAAATFATEVRRIVAARDIDALIALAEKDVAMGFDGPTGPEVMRRDFMGAGGGLWQELEEAVALGCAISEGGYVQMPWMSVQDIPGDFFDYMVVTGNSVAVRERPDASSTQLGVVSWDVVDLAHNEDERGPTIYGGPDNGGWTKVSTRSSPSVTGYIRNENLRSTADYRLVALRGPNGFRISAFLAGD